MTQGVSTTVRAEGFAEAIRQMETLSDTVARNALAKALAPGAEYLAARYRTVAPVLTGKLLGSITIAPPKKGRRNWAETRVVVGDVAGVMYEYGNTRQPARPVFRQAAEAAKGEMTRLTAEAVKVEIAAAVGRVAARGARGG